MHQAYISPPKDDLTEVAFGALHRLSFAGERGKDFQYLQRIERAVDLGFIAVLW